MGSDRTRFRDTRSGPRSSRLTAVEFFTSSECVDAARLGSAALYKLLARIFDPTACEPSLIEAGRTMSVGIRTIHFFEGPSFNTERSYLGGLDLEQRTAFHHDIKSENTLLFQPEDGSPEDGSPEFDFTLSSLRISDFGASKFDNRGHIEVVRFLLEKGADLAVADKNGWTPHGSSPLYSPIGGLSQAWAGNLSPSQPTRAPAACIQETRCCALQCLGPNLPGRLDHLRRPLVAQRS